MAEQVRLPECFVFCTTQSLLGHFLLLHTLLGTILSSLIISAPVVNAACVVSFSSDPRVFRFSLYRCRVHRPLLLACDFPVFSRQQPLRYHPRTRYGALLLRPLAYQRYYNKKVSARRRSPEYSLGNYRLLM